MKKWLFTLIIVLTTNLVLFAQNLETGIKALYYEKYSEAQSILETIVNKNPNDTKAAYWLGQVYLQNNNFPDRITKAKQIYQESLSKNFNSPYLLVGMGEIDLLTNNDIPSAKQKFEQAILSSKEDPDILNAVGRANASGKNTTGDPSYSIEILKKTAMQDPKNPDIEYNLALNSLKLNPNDQKTDIDYLLKAITLDNKYSKAYFTIGKIYYDVNPILANDNFLKSMAMDSNYAPSYRWAFNLAVKNKNYILAEKYIKKYIALSEDKTLSQYYLAWIEIQNKDYASAQKNISIYLSNSSLKQIQNGAYILAAKAFSPIVDSSKFYYEKAIKTDTIHRLEAIDSLINIYGRDKDTMNMFIWMKKKYISILASENEYKNETLTPQICTLALKNIPFFKDKEEYAFIDSIFRNYVQLYPNDEFGYYGIVKISMGIDSSYQKALQPINSYI
ncbi:MAG: hypothetical protein DI598_10200, partial [Pseudopedobacter saltans]